MESLIIVILFIILFTVWFLSVRRRLLVMNENIDNAMSQIGVQISSQFHVLVSLLDLVKEHAEEEAKMLTAEVKIWKSVITAESSTDEVIRQEMLISDTLEKMTIVAKEYPELKSDENYVRYMDAMDCYEGMIHTSCLIYNDSVSKYNRFVLLFPISLIVRILGFHRRDYLEFSEYRTKTNLSFLKEGRRK